MGDVIGKVEKGWFIERFEIQFEQFLVLRRIMTMFWTIYDLNSNKFVISNLKKDYKQKFDRKKELKLDLLYCLISV